MTICRAIMTLALCMLALFGPSLAWAQRIHRCPSGTILQCTSEAGPLICQCLPIPPTFPVTGEANGLTGQGLSLEVYNSDVENPLQIGVYKSGPLKFYVPAGRYTIVVNTEPVSPTQACVLTNGSGTAPTSTPFTLNCGTGYTVGGTLSGLATNTGGGPIIGLALKLQTTEYTAPQDIFPSANGSFTFPAPIADGQPYQVTVSNQPQGQICTVSPNNGTGTINSADVTNIAVSCPGDIVACDKLGCMSELALSNGIANGLTSLESLPISPAVAGYVVLVGDLPPAAAGQARIAPDTNSQAMSPDLPINIESVSKTLTAIAVLQLLRPLAPDVTVDTPIAKYLYSDWTLGPYVSKITFRELLTHTSGFGVQAPTLTDPAKCTELPTPVDTYDQVKTLVANGLGPNTVLPTIPCYQNANFALLRELLPALYYKSNNNPIGQQSDSETDPNGNTMQCPWGLGNAPCSPRSRASSDKYIEYLNTNVFGGLSLSNQSCTSALTSGILAYPFPPSPPGHDWGDYHYACGAGGWQLKASDLFKVINELATGLATATDNKLLTKDETLAMISNCLGWDCAVRGDCPNPYVCKNGGPPPYYFNGQLLTTSTYAGILKCVPVVVYVNSVLPPPYPLNGDIIGLVGASYDAAQVNNGPPNCPYP
jgi:beta-lactamase family protein